MQALHQKTLLDADFPLKVFTTDVTEFPPHWHQAVEVVYVLDGSLKIGVNNEIYTLNARDMMLISGGDIHYFVPQPRHVNRIILHFEMAFFESFSTVVKDKRFTRILLKESDSAGSKNGICVHSILEEHILGILKENEEKREGYKIALKARLFDILVILLRHIPMESYSAHEKNRHLNRLERLENVFRYVERNFGSNIRLDEISAVANFSVYYFTRFFKEATGMTFVKYVNNYRVAKAAEYLIDTDDPITEVVFKSGFGSIKTFNRVFKQLKGCSPSQYKKAISEE
jgi:AraC-like DNA-binding protein